MQAKLFEICLLVVITALVVGGGACSRETAEVVSAGASEGAPPEPADRDIDAAMKLIEKLPDSPLPLTQLAVLYIKKARWTGDFGYNNKAETAVQKALAIKPNDGMARKLQASLHLTFHRFSEALELGNKLLKEFPNDAFVFGVLTDANLELGNYPEAVSAAQKMVNQRPNSNAYARVAQLRALHGDHEGSVEMYKQAARTADPADKEAQSWSLVQLGDELLKRGKYIEAEKVYDEALANFPDFHMATAGKGRARAAQGDLESAIKYLSDAQNRVPNVETIVTLADIYTKQGNTEKAAEQAQLVQAVEQNLGQAGDQRRLALFWADRDTNLKEALTIAEAEHKLKKDIYTADTYAWCLLKNGRANEAAAIIKQAMRLKTGDARIMYHAGMIENARGNRSEAKRLLNDALRTNPQFDLLQAGQARAALETIK